MLMNHPDASVDSAGWGVEAHFSIIEKYSSGIGLEQTKRNTH
jgi:hypothetical protein